MSNFHLKYRPSTLEEFKGNSGLTNSLKIVLQSPTTPHSFMFIGNSGCGKTTLGRIIAKYLNCHPSELKEINMADLRGIDFIRQLIYECRYKPLMGNIKVYILDEYHQATPESQNSLLKILEDTPSHVYFILCTTAPEKILPTIQTRCYKYVVNPLNNPEMRELLQEINRKENLDLKPEIIEVIIEACEGIPRTALIMLGMLKGINNIEDALDIVYLEGLQQEEIITLCRAIVKGIEWKELINIFKNLTITDYEKIRLAIVGYLGGCLTRARDEYEVIKFQKLIEIFIPVLNYNSAKNDLIFRISKARKPGITYKEGI